MSEFEELRKIAEEQLRISVADIDFPPVPVGKGILDHIEHTEVIEVTKDMIKETLEKL